MDTFEQFSGATELGWPLLLALAWVVGELGYRWTKLPRISLYALVGFAAAQLGGTLLPAAGDNTGMLLANISFGLILFEFGYRINLRWLRINPWLGASGVLEASLTFVAIYFLSRAWGSPVLTSLLLASLSMSTSPAAVMRVINEQRSAGQVTERLLHLTALNCVLSVFAFKVVVGFWAFDSSGNVWQAVSSSVLVLVASAALGIAFGIGMPGLLRRLGTLGRDATVAFAVAVILLVGIAQAFKLSPLLAALAFGLVARHHRVALTQTQRNFGVLGELLAVALFTYTAMAVEWPRVVAGLGLGLALVTLRLVIKVACVTALARASGSSWRKGALTGLALTPISVFVILLLDQTRYLGIDLLDQLAPLAAATLLLELVGPAVSQYALRRAGECRESEGA
ncbi:cation:proton antiporter [Azohydromonas aeria]|uniref:cation:proton antiporter n=1 Tax=Azohydromonas aeria TaxID=2590212 RepID=UPI0012F7092F|nr:cation:proton antiporter [Azohydromonas aeria]